FPADANQETREADCFRQMLIRKRGKQTASRSCHSGSLGAGPLSGHHDRQVLRTAIVATFAICLFRRRTLTVDLIQTCLVVPVLSMHPDLSKCPARFARGPFGNKLPNPRRICCGTSRCRATRGELEE